MYDTLAIKTLDALDRRNFSLIRSYFTLDAVASGGFLPDCLPLSVAFKVMHALFAAIPDFSFEIENLAEHGDEVTVELNGGGRHDRPFKLGLLGLPDIQPTGKNIHLSQLVVFTGYHDKFCALRIASRAEIVQPAHLTKAETYAYANVS